jgi:hypothetical protein
VQQRLRSVAYPFVCRVTQVRALIMHWVLYPSRPVRSAKEQSHFPAKLHQ